jgi:hypothetical protein
LSTARRTLSDGTAAAYSAFIAKPNTIAAGNAFEACAGNVTRPAQVTNRNCVDIREAAKFFAASFEIRQIARCILQRELATSPATSPPRYANTSPRDV